MAEIIKSRFGFLKKTSPQNSASPANAEPTGDRSATSPPSQTPAQDGVERRREVATHLHGAHRNESPTGPSPTGPSQPGLSQTNQSPETGSDPPPPAATKAARDVSGLAGFNLNDLANQGKASLDAARAEVRRMLDQAKAEVQAIHDDAKRAGFAEGKQQADVDFQRRVDEAAEAKSKASVATMKTTVAAMQKELNHWMASYNDHLNELIIGATQRIVTRKLEDEPELVVRWTGQALQSTRSATKLVVAVHPDTLVNLGDQFESILQWSELPEQTEVRPDESVAIGDVSIRQTGGEIRAGLTAQLERLKELLT